MMVRAFHLWRQTRWPGRSGRLRFAHTLFNLYVLRSLELLSLQLWDLTALQQALDELWKSSPPDQPVFVRDARWLIQMAQSPATDDLGAYFAVAQKLAESFSAGDRIEIHKAGVRMAGGHLRSQIRHYATTRNVAFDDSVLVLNTRTTNALDFALLIQELVPLLDAYEKTKRLDLADAILQGVSPDPELFLNRLELLGPYSMLEHLFVTTDGDNATYTTAGRRHVQLFQEYCERIVRVRKQLSEDCARFRPVAGSYSPYGALFGFSTHLVEHLALKALQPDAAVHFSIEDVFAAGGADTLAWVNGWRRLPHVDPEVARRFDYPQQFAEQIFDRIERSLRDVAAEREASVERPAGRLILSADDNPGTLKPSPVPESERNEGKCLVSYPAAGGWLGISKAILTKDLIAGRDVTITGLPPKAISVLRLVTPPELIQN
jgi:hypothetical protein